MQGMAGSSLQSLFCGDAAYGGQSYANSWSCIIREDDGRNLLTYLSYMRHPWLKYHAPADSSLGDQICLPELSGVQTRLRTLSDKLEQERQSLAALPERVRQKWDDAVQFAELVRDLKQ